VIFAEFSNMKTGNKYRQASGCCSFDASEATLNNLHRGFAARLSVTILPQATGQSLDVCKDFPSFG